MTSIGSWITRWRGLALGALLACSASGALAQQSTVSAGSGLEPEPVVLVRRGFSLFGLGDFAVTGLRQGGSSTWATTSSGPHDAFPGIGTDLPGRITGTIQNPNGYCCGYFELQLWMAAARGDWARARDNIPSLENVRGGGWNSRTQLSRWVTDPEQLVFSGRDGSVGFLYSGVTSEAGTGSCRDNSTRPNNNVSAGIPLLAGSDCPPTWAGPTFQGERVVADTTWIRRFQASRNSFTFDDWRVPAAERSDRLYGSFQTFGATNDYGKEVRARAGNVVPGGTGRSNLEGYPMGIEWEFQVFTYAVPTIGDAMFYKANIINKSREVYGVGIDYDSLSLGFMVRPFHTTDAQAPAVYADIVRGAFLSNQNNANRANCYGNKILGTDIRQCLGNTNANTGFRAGGGALVILKSPIGDLRNKKFTDPTSPFFAPSHPQRGDTITFNLASSCGFTCATQQITPGSVQATYGALVQAEAPSFNGRGRTPGELTQRQYHDLIRNADWPNRWSPQTGNVGGYNRFVPPGNWDYNKDGVADTLKVTTCHTSGCVTPWTDTLPGGFPNNFHNNYFGGAGPIKLKAGDTTSYVVAFVSSRDSVSLEQQVNNIVSLYQAFWLSPQPPCATNIASATADRGNRQFDTRVRLFFDQQLNECSDEFLLDQARRLRASTLPSDIRLRVLNPQLVNDIRARALPAGRTLVDTVARDTLLARSGACTSAATFSAANCLIVTRQSLGVVDSLFVFKSCDGGGTYTASSAASCEPAPARDVSTASPGGYPWQSYARLGRNAGGRFPSVYEDPSVTAGVTYTYVVVGQSYPAVFNVTDVQNGQFVSTQYVVRPKAQNALTANAANRNVANVYVPASYQAGSDTTQVRFNTVNVAGLPVQDTLAAYAGAVRLSRPIRSETPINGRIILSDSAEVVVFDADTTVAGVTSTTVRLFALVDSLVTATGAAATGNRRIIAQRDSLVLPGSAGMVDIASRLGTAAVQKDSVVAGTRSKFTIYRFAANPSGGARPQVTFVSEGRPLFVTDTIPAGLDLTPAQTLTRPDFNGLLFSFNPTLTRTLRPGDQGGYWSQEGIGLLRNTAFPTIRWIPGVQRDSVTFAGFSRYRITFADKEFGPGAPFTLNQRDPSVTGRQYTESINQRKTASSTDASAEAAAVLGRRLGRNLTADSLAQLALPFTVTNVRYGRAVRVAVLRSEHPTSALLGTSGDTLRVPVPADKWIPGDRLYFIETIPSTRYDTIATSPAIIQRVRLGANGVPDTVAVTRVTWAPTTLGCDVPAAPVTPAQTCNPVSGLGGTGYKLTNANQSYEVQYYSPLGGLISFPFTVSPEVAGAQVARVSSDDLSQVRVVPNPYIMFSEYEQTRGVERLLFINLPPRGTINIYTASGQFVQRLTWVESDLDRNCRATAATTACVSTGDLFWNMRTREDLRLGPGFYVFVVSTDVGGRKAERLGKFVVIR